MTQPTFDRFLCDSQIEEMGFFEIPAPWTDEDVDQFLREMVPPAEV